ncbi:Telomeric repeat-binding factor 1 [Spatholobus suberectus]|nr:Telomeric repeat-binding factor 1 [Spatholobus suberectus]
MGPSFLESVAAMSKAKGKSIKNNDNDNDNNNSGDDDNGGSGACMEDVAMHDENQEVGGCDLPPQRDKVAIQKRNPQLKLKLSALRTCNRGVKISGPEEVEPAKSWSKHDPVPSAEVRKVRESLKSSSLELRALIKDPLPDALHTSEVVRSKLATRDTNIEPSIENQREDVDVPDPNVCKSIVLFQPNDANLGKKSSVHCSNVHQPCLMERKRSARSFEWDDSIDNSPQARQPRRRKGNGLHWKKRH